MASITLEGPFDLKSDTIAAIVTLKSPGSFVLGHVDENGNFVPRRVGRADMNLEQELELQAQLNNPYTAFKFRYAATPHAAFDQQCSDFHACGECEALENKHHPMRPSHTDWSCPVCGKAFL